MQNAYVNTASAHFWLLADLLFEEAYLSSTPRLLWEVIKRLAAYQLHGSFFVPSHGSHVTALIAFLAVTGREYHCPHCLSSPFWVLPRSLRKAVSRSVSGKKA